MESLSGREVLLLGQLQGSPHSSGQLLVPQYRTIASNQLQARTDHMAHYYVKEPVT